MSRIFSISLACLGFMFASDLNASQKFSDYELQTEVKRQLSIYYHQDVSHLDEFKLETVVVPKDSFHEGALFVCQARERNGSIQDLFIKTDTGRKETENLNTVRNYFRTRTEQNIVRHLCLPFHIARLSEDFDADNIVIAPKAMGIDFGMLIRQYERGRISGTQFNEFISNFGSVVGMLHRAGDLEISGSKLKTRCIHKDLNADNVICAPEKGLIQLIDLETMADSLRRDKKSNIYREFAVVFRLVLQVSRLFHENTFYPSFSFIGSFLEGYSSASGLEKNRINPLLHRYAMEIIIQCEMMASAEAIPVKDQENRREVVNQLDLYLRNLLNITRLKIETGSE